MPKTKGALALASYDDIFQIGPAVQTSVEQVQEVPLNELFPFENHPFQVRDDEGMQKTAESVNKYGVLVPGIVRPRPEGGYEIVAGHRRKRACELAGKAAMPVLIRNLDDDEATIIMVDTNLQRETLLPSEKAWAYRMKLEALNHRGVKLEGIVPGTLSADMVAKQAGESKSQIFRYIRLTELVPNLLDMTDAGKIAFNPAVELSYLSRKEQSALLDCMAKYEATPSHSQALRLKKYSQAGTLTGALLDEIMGEEKKPPAKITLTGSRLSEYFPSEYTPKQMETVILKLLDGWRRKRAANE